MALRPQYIIAKSKRAFLEKCAEIGSHPQTTVHLHSFVQIKDKLKQPLQIAVADDWSELSDTVLIEYVKYKGLV